MCSDQANMSLGRGSQQGCTGCLLGSLGCLSQVPAHSEPRRLGHSCWRGPKTQHAQHCRILVCRILCPWSMVDSGLPTRWL